MKERPILFSGPMVLAIIDGRQQPKTQTRRIVKPVLDKKTHSPFLGEDGIWRWMTGKVSYTDDERKCPYGAPGDQLWVRERWGLADTAGYLIDPTLNFQADRSQKPIDPKIIVPGYRHRVGWRPSIHMPRWASRLSLEILEVRVERVQDISEDDAKAEGLKCLTKDQGRTFKYGICDRDGWPGNDDYGWAWAEWEVDPRKAFAKAWDQINGKREGCSWADNPWVWALTFKRIEVAP